MFKAPLKDRVVIFIDYQNVYKVAQNYFGYQTGAQLNVSKLALNLMRHNSENRHLKQIRIYSGMPSKKKQSNAYSSFRRKMRYWQLDPLVRVITRPLSYPLGWPKSSKPGEKPREKGIDVNIAIDFVTMAIRKEYEIGILFSVDTDLKPALEFVVGNDVLARAEVAAWRQVADHQIRLALSSNRPFCHWLTKDDFLRLAL